MLHGFLEMVGAFALVTLAVVGVIAPFVLAIKVSVWWLLAYVVLGVMFVLFCLVAATGEGKK